MGERLEVDVAVRDLELNRVRESAAEAERLGYDGLWTQETQHEAFLPLAVGSGDREDPTGDGDRGRVPRTAR